MSEISIQAKDGGTFSAYLAKPASLPAPAIILIQEIFGVNADLRAKADEWAAKGYLVYVPDLFWRLEPNVQLTDKSQAEWDKAFALLNDFDIVKGIDDLAAVLDFLRLQSDCSGVVGCMGFCLGGKLAYLMAANTSVDCSVSYYGVGLEDMLDLKDSIKKPLMLHIAEEDKFVPPAAQEKIKTALADHEQVIIHSYEGMNHAFTRLNGEHFDADATILAHGRTEAFLKASLQEID